MAQDSHVAATTHPCWCHRCVCHLCHHRLSPQLEAEATHRVITIANRVSGPELGGSVPVLWGSLCLRRGAGTPQGAGLPWGQQL